MSFDVSKAIEDLCQSISVTRSLDDAIREEITSHLREKVSYYLNKGRLSEEEAFILARHALGDPGRFVPALQRVHCEARATDRAFGLLSVLGMVLVIQVTSASIARLGLDVLVPTLARSGLTGENVLGPLSVANQIGSYLIACCVVWRFSWICRCSCRLDDGPTSGDRLVVRAGDRARPSVGALEGLGGA